MQSWIKEKVPFWFIAVVGVKSIFSFQNDGCQIVFTVEFSFWNIYDWGSFVDYGRVSVSVKCWMINDISWSKALIAEIVVELKMLLILKNYLPMSVAQLIYNVNWISFNKLHYSLLLCFNYSFNYVCLFAGWQQFKSERIIYQ